VLFWVEIGLRQISIN